MTEQTGNPILQTPAAEAQDAPAPLEEMLVAAGTPTPLRVAWVAGPETFSRTGRILQPLALGLMDELVSPTVLVPEHSQTREMPNLPMDVLRYSRLHWLMFRRRMITQLAGELENRQINLIHALDGTAAELARRLAMASGLRYVVSCYGKFQAARLRHLEGQATALLAASEPIRRELLEHHVAPADRIHLVRPGVYQVGHATCFTEPGKSMAIVAGGEMNDFLSYQAVLKAFVEVKNRGFDAAFFIIANGKAETSVRQAARDLGLSQRLTFIDRQQMAQMQGILKGADIYISPETSTEMDITSLVAMAAGDPVLTADGRLDDFLIDGKTACVYRQGDAADLTAKLLGLLADRPRATSLAEAALSHLRQKHSPAAMVSQVTQIYRDAAAGQSAQRAG